MPSEALVTASTLSNLNINYESKFDYEYTLKCHLDDIKSAEELGKAAAENTIRKLFGISIDKNSVHQGAVLEVEALQWGSLEDVIMNSSV